MHFLDGGANLAPAFGRAQAKVQNPRVAIKVARHALDENKWRELVSVRHLNPEANFCVKGSAVLCTLWTVGQTWYLEAVGPPQAKVQNPRVAIKVARQAFDGNKWRELVSVRHLNPGENLCVKRSAVLCTLWTVGQTWYPATGQGPKSEGRHKSCTASFRWK